MCAQALERLNLGVQARFLLKHMPDPCGKLTRQTGIHEKLSRTTDQHILNPNGIFMARRKTNHGLTQPIAQQIVLAWETHHLVRFRVIGVNSRRVATHTVRQTVLM
jgi:hypothetical protein